jgi:hypothetical protein
MATTKVLLEITKEVTYHKVFEMDTATFDKLQAMYESNEYESVKSLEDLLDEYIDNSTDVYYEGNIEILNFMRCPDDEVKP